METEITCTPCPPSVTAQALPCPLPASSFFSGQFAGAVDHFFPVELRRGLCQLAGVLDHRFGLGRQPSLRHVVHVGTCRPVASQRDGMPPDGVYSLAKSCLNPARYLQGLTYTLGF